jgi:hypothetical protein
MPQGITRSRLFCGRFSRSAAVCQSTLAAEIRKAILHECGEPTMIGKDSTLAEDSSSGEPLPRSGDVSAKPHDGLDLARTLMAQAVVHHRTVTFSLVAGPDGSATKEHVLIVIKETGGSRQMQYGAPTTNRQGEQITDEDWIRVIQEMSDELDSRKSN